MSGVGIQMVTLFIVTYKTEQMDTRIGAVYFRLDDARREMERLDKATPFGHAGIEIRQAQVYPEVLQFIEELT